MAIRTTFNQLDLCSGSGMSSVAAKIVLGEQIQTVCYVEREAYAAATLVARMEEANLDKAPVWDDIKTFDGKPWRSRVHIITAGYPCQPFSYAGKRLGEDDSRHLWPDIARIIGEVKSPVVFLENVRGHLTLGFDTVTTELAKMGYSVAAGLFTASEVGASHKRERLFILGVADATKFGFRQGEQDKRGCGKGVSQREERRMSANKSSVVANTGEQGLQGSKQSITYRPINGIETFCMPLFAPGPNDQRWRQILRIDPTLKPAICGMADGLANRVDRLRLAGNGWVSMVGAYAFISLFAGYIIAHRLADRRFARKKGRLK